MVADLTELARNALGCLDLREDTGGGQELHVIYEASSPFKDQLARAMGEVARGFDVKTTLLDIDEFLGGNSDDTAVEQLTRRLTYQVEDPLQRNAINMVAPQARYDNVRRRVTREALIDGSQAYVLQFPFVHQETAEAILSVDPAQAERVALRMKADLDRATHYHLESGEGHVMEWPVNPRLVWVPSVGKVKKYSPRGPKGESIGGWENPGCEIFTSFAVTEADHERISGSYYVDAFASGRVLKPSEAFVVRVSNGAVDLETLQSENPNVDGKFMEELVRGFRTDEYAAHLGELGIGLMPAISLEATRETLPLEKIGGTLHIAPGYDESDRGTGGGFAMSAAHNDLGIRQPRFDARIDGKWKTVLADGKCTYFSNAS
ncbi:MAG: hypothetical protein ABIH92_02110 [Nanoarchaeota archaeon]